MNRELKDICNWIDGELNLIHFFLYIILGNILGGFWWILIGPMMMLSFGTAIVRMKNGGTRAYKEIKKEDV